MSRHIYSTGTLIVNSIVGLRAETKDIFLACLELIINEADVIFHYSQGLYDHKVHTYLEHHSVCPLVGIGTAPPPLPQASVYPPSPEPKGGHARLRVGGGGWGSSNSDDWRKSLALCLLYGCD
jgi:hypothetical protein